MIIGKLKPLKKHYPRNIEVGYSLLKKKGLGKTSAETRGENNGHSRLTEEAVVFIRKSKDSLRLLGERFGVSPSHIANIKAKRAWSHVP
jgi:hypothetical protein